MMGLGGRGASPAGSLGPKPGWDPGPASGKRSPRNPGAGKNPAFPYGAFPYGAFPYGGAVARFRCAAAAAKRAAATGSPVAGGYA